ncbi:MAG: DUF2996 domain-containing protein [Limnothrix sp. CACIAM 69d]|nr:MAG: DUF2996 domain-containing protein [Limnothrix sp. CACIAM 69d]
MADNPEVKAEVQAKSPAAAPKAAPAKEKAPKPEDKPFGEFIETEYLPALQKALVDRGVAGLALQFVNATVPIKGLEDNQCSQVIGSWGDREFRVYFPKDDINATKGFSYTEKGGPHSTLEPFLIDERKASLDLLVNAVALRLRAQKWIERN